MAASPDDIPSRYSKQTNTNNSQPPVNPNKSHSNPDNEAKRKDEIRKQIDNVAIRLQAGLENGLFEQKKVKEKGPQWTEIQNLVSIARDKLDKNLGEAESRQEEALNTYFVAINNAGAKWRFYGLYAGPIWIFLVGILAATFMFYISGTGDKLTDPKNLFNLLIPRAAVDATAWGIIGSVLRGLWWLRFNVARNNYRKGWNLHYISSPFIGGILGAIVYILILGGLVSVTNQQLTPTNSLAIIPIAAFAGFNWEWAVKLFKKIEKIIDTEKDDNSK